MPELRNATVTIGVPGLNGTGVSGAEKTDIFDRITALEAVTVPATIDDLSDVDTTTAAPASGDLLQYDGANWVPYTPAGMTVDVALNYSIDGGGATITTGLKYGFRTGFAGTITGYALGADQSTTSSIGIWQRAHTSFPPTITQLVQTMTITADTDSEVTGLNITFQANHWFFFDVTANNNAEWIGIHLMVDREVGP